MRMSLGRFGIFGVRITICIGPFEICIEKSLDLWQEVFIARVSFINRMKGLKLLAQRSKERNTARGA